MAKGKEYIQIDLDRVGELTVRFAVSQMLKAQMHDPRDVEKMQKKTAARQLADALLPYIKWEGPQPDDAYQCDIWTGTVRIIKPWSSAPAAPTSDKST